MTAPATVGGEVCLTMPLVSLILTDQTIREGQTNRLSCKSGDLPREQKRE